MERQQLEYFVAVVDYGGFSRASEAVHVAQPSLSKGIGALERNLGTPLFHRLGRKVALTSAGEALLAPARQILRDHATADAAVARVRGVYDGTLDLATTPTLAVHPLTAILGRFRQLYPQVSVRIAESDVPGGPAVVVGGGKSELGLVELPVPGASLVSTRLLKQTFYLVLPPDGASPRTQTVDLSILGDLPLITTPPGTSSRTRLERALSVGRVGTASIVLETIYRATIPSLVAAGVGAALLPDHNAADALAIGARVFRTQPRVDREVGLVRRSGPLSPSAEALLEVATDMAPFADPLLSVLPA